jgi:hypothetical protein
VRLVHEKYSSLDAYQAAITRHAERDDLDFMDGIIHSPTSYVLCAGYFVDRAPYTSRYDWLRVYYQSTATRADDYMTTRDYLFRYDRGVTNVRPSSFLGRLLFGKWISSTQMLRLGERLHWLLPTNKPTVTLDVFVPFSKVPAFLSWYQRELDFFPLWCVPYKRVRDYEWLDPKFYAR